MHPRTLELLAYLAEHRANLRAAFLSVPASQRDVARRPERWSAASVIEHLSLVEGALAQRLVAEIGAGIAEGIGQERDESPVLPTLISALARIPDRRTHIEASPSVQPTGLTAEVAWNSFERSNEAVRSALKGGDGLALGTRFLQNRLLGNISIYHYVAFVGAHEARHALQLQELALELPGD